MDKKKKERIPSHLPREGKYTIVYFICPIVDAPRDSKTGKNAKHFPGIQMTGSVHVPFSTRENWLPLFILQNYFYSWIYHPCFINRVSINLKNRVVKVRRVNRGNLTGRSL